MTDLNVVPLVDEGLGDSGPTVVRCGHGERAMGGASLLARDGASEVTVLQGGPQDWAEATGGSVEVEE